MRISVRLFNHPLIAFFIVLLSISAAAKKKLEKPAQLRVDPPFWFVQMEQDTVEILLHQPQINRFKALEWASGAYQGVEIIGIKQVPNENYLFARLVIHNSALPGFLQLKLSSSDKKVKSLNFQFELKEKKVRKRGLTPNDAIYLVFPDRFANGDTTNDRNPHMYESSVDRKGLKTRHGGDIQGCIHQLDYIQSMGFTALWLNPILESNQPYESYHGYAMTDLYKVDPRMGQEADYLELVNRAHSKGLKIIWDAVYNHWGNENWLIRDLPDSAWVHWSKPLKRTNYRAETLIDPYASSYDKDLMLNGWFDKHMPDLNQQNPELARYLIQNTIWWIEFAGIDALRIDTYAYNDQLFMKKLNEALRAEFPDFFIFGEVWVQSTPVEAWFPEQSRVNSAFNSSLHGITDFQLYGAITKGLNEPFGWEEGLRRIESTLTHDILYYHPYNNVTHLDNHDLSRFYGVVGENFAKWKMGITMLLTLRGIPQIYYGTEILMKKFADPDAYVREDFPGGWPRDSINKFERAGRNERENEAFDFLQLLLHWRKNHEWFGNSKLTQFVPTDDTWVYFRHDADHTLMCVYSTSNESKTLDLARFAECIKNKSLMKDILTGDTKKVEATLTVAPMSVAVYELR